MASVGSTSARIEHTDSCFGDFLLRAQSASLNPLKRQLAHHPKVRYGLAKLPKSKFELC
jgi:hypothetical protein